MVTQKQGGRDRHTRSRCAGDQGKHLYQTDQQCVAERYSSSVFRAAPGESVSNAEKHTEQKRGYDNHVNSTRIGGDHILEQQAS